MRKKVFNVLFISILISMVGYGILAPVLPAYAKNLGANGIWLGIIFAAFSVSRGSFTPLMGRISDEKGRKIFITAGLFLFSVSYLLYLIAKTPLSLALIRLFQGFAAAMTFPIAMAYIGEMTDKGEEGLSMGTLNMAFFLGMSCGPLLGGLITGSLGMPSAFFATALLTVISFIIVILFLPDLRPPDTESRKIVPFTAIIKDDAVKGIFLFRFIDAAARSGFIAFLPILALAMRIPIYRLGILFTVNLLLTALLQRPFGRFADRHNKFLLVLAGSGVVTAMLLAIPFCSNFRDLLIASSVMGIGSAVALPSAASVAVEIGKKGGMGALLGMLSTAMSIGMITAPLVLGFVLEGLGVYFIFYFAGGISLLGMALFYHFTKTCIRNGGSRCLPIHEKSNT